MKKLNKLAIVLAFSLLLSQSAAIANAKEAPKTTKTTTTATKQTTNQAPAKVNTLTDLKPVNISGKSTVTLTDVNILTLDEGDVLTYTLTFNNKDAKDIALIDYWSRVKSKSGTVYSSNLTTKDKEKKRVAPQSQVNITYFAKIGKNTKISDLIFEVVKWDFSKPNYENQLGKFQIPSNFTTATPFSKVKNMNMNGIWAKASVSQFYMYQSEDYNYATVGLQIENAGFKVLEDPKYKFVVRTPDGANYPLQADAASVEYKIQPGDKKTLNLVTMIPKTVKTDKLQLQILQEDGGEKVETTSLAIGTFDLPTKTMNELVTGSYEVNEITVGNAKLAGKISTARISRGIDDYNVSLNFNLKNSSAQTVTVPNYEFVVRANDGYSFPVPTKVLENTTLKPLEEKNIRLSVSIPEYVGIENLKLSVNMPSDPNAKEKMEFPVAIFKIPEVNPTSNSKGVKYTINNEKGNFTVQLSSIQRLPWVDGDIIAANMKIQNAGTKAIELPKMEGVFKIDGADASGDSKLVQSNSSLVVPPKGTLDLYMTAKVPYGLDFAELQVSLLEKIGESSFELIDFVHTGKIDEIPTVEFGNLHTIHTSGRQAEITTRKTVVYPGVGSNIIATDLEMKNIETRQANLSQIVGYYVTPENQYYQANVTQVDHAVSPNGKSIVTLWTKVPKNITVGDMNLIIGEGIMEDKMTPPKEKSTGYVNAVALGLELDTNQYKNGFSNLEIYPYKFSITNLKGELMGSSARIDFTYNLDRDLEYEMGEYEHKLVIELTDSAGHINEKEIVFEKDIQLGNNKSFSISFDGSSFDENTSGVYQLTLHDSFQGQKRKIAHNGIYFTGTPRE